MSENRRYAQEIHDITEYASRKIGSRLPGTENERKFANYMGDKLRELGIEPKTEIFSVAPRAAIGGLPYAGWAGIIISFLTYFALDNYHIWYAMAFISVVVTTWLICGPFLYKTWFDMFFKQEISQNVYGEMIPEDGKYDYTIILSGHTDTCWNWKHSEHIYKYKNKPIIGLVATYAKVGFGAVCYFFMAFVSVFMAALYSGLYSQSTWALTLAGKPWLNTFMYLLHFIPMITAFGCCFVAMWNDKDPNNASTGAMDNATGCATAYEVLKYYKENPEKAPKNARLIAFNCGSEEASLRGSTAFVREHKGEAILENTWNINIDSIADEDYFEVVIKDDWQFTRFDKDLEKMFKDTFAEMQIESKSGGCIHNPVGGCDSTPMTKAGIKSVTFAAQNPMLTYYYHTFRDLPDRFSVDTCETGFNVVLSVVDKIAAFQEANGFNGVNN